MKLGIIIPTYNSLPTLKKLIKDIFKYTTGDYQVYVIEDGRRRKTINWLYTQKDPRLHTILHLNNKGIASSWNDGLDAAMNNECTHFAILNDDIELCRDWWNMSQELFRDGVHLVSLDVPCPIPVITGWFFILDKECIEKIGIFDEQFGPFTSEDTDYAYRYLASGMKYAKVKLDIIHHGGGSTTINQLDPEYFKRIQIENWQKLRKKYPHMSMPSQL